HLNDTEQDLIRQGRNVGVGVGRRSTQAEHRQATGFETLIGALHLRNPARLSAIWTLLLPHLEVLREAATNPQSPTTDENPNEAPLLSSDPLPVPKEDPH